MDPSEVAIEVESLHLRYPRRWHSPAVEALAGVDLTLQRGEIFAVLGPNGSGKTSLLEVLSGGLTASSGRVTILGLPPGDRSLIRRVGYQPEGPLPFKQLDPREFLDYLGNLMGLDRAFTALRRDALLQRLGLRDVANRAHGGLSTGMSRRLALAAAMLCEPEVLFLDEPTSGLDPEASLVVIELLTELAEKDCAILMASHHLQEVEHVCDRVCVLIDGKKTAQGTLDELLASDEEVLTVTGLDQAGRDQVSATADQAGGKVRGWRRGRRHLHALFRDGPRP